MHQRLTVFETDRGLTVVFGERSYFIEAEDPFYNIAVQARNSGDYLPYYI
ncbi:MAG: hypothetical protein ACOCVG_03870 [Verrucomicrobiota bacterium]